MLLADKNIVRCSKVCSGSNSIFLSGNVRVVNSHGFRFSFCFPCRCHVTLRVVKLFRVVYVTVIFLSTTNFLECSTCTFQIVDVNVNDCFFYYFKTQLWTTSIICNKKQTKKRSKLRGYVNRINFTRILTLLTKMIFPATQ